jgi:hypothetical protein
MYRQTEAGSAARDTYRGHVSFARVVCGVSSVAVFIWRVDVGVFNVVKENLGGDCGGRVTDYL